jgi:hypothetical protein
MPHDELDRLRILRLSIAYHDRNLAESRLPVYPIYYGLLNPAAGCDTCVMQFWPCKHIAKARMGGMKIAILYGSPRKLSNAHKLVSHHGGSKDFGCQPLYYVRMKVLNWKARQKRFQGEFGLDEAMRFAEPPMEGETLLNTVYIEPPEPTTAERYRVWKQAEPKP